MKITSNKAGLGLILGGVIAIAATSSPALATDGYFQVGFGARQSALGGAGVADSRDAMSQSLNPAGIAGVDNQWQIGATVFMPFRGYTGNATVFVAPGSVDSDANVFVVPNFAYTHRIDDVSSIGVSFYGNGGMNTSYPNVTNPNCVSGVFCSGASGVDLMQAFVSVDYARKIGSFKFGIAPTFALQRFKARGLAAFGAGSADATKLTNNGYDYSYGGGLRGGIEWELMPNLRLGLSGQTKMFMTKFDKYAGLFAEQGSFDIPATITAGIAFDARPDLTLMFDYQRIFYGGVPSVSNPSVTGGLLGANNGPGFGWHDVNVFKVGAEWRANDIWTVRAGYAFSDNPVQSADAMFNILAPGIVQHHFTAGGSYKLTERDTLEFSGMYVPESTLTGPELAGGVPTGRTLTLNMHQFQVGFSWTRKY